MSPDTTTILLDTREPEPHPWTPYWPEADIIRGTLGVGDVCLLGNADVVVERKTPADLVACITGERERFERELRRATHLASFAVVVSGSLDAVLLYRRTVHVNSIVGTLAAWQRRYRIPFVFAGTDALAAQFAWRFLTQPVREAQRLLAEAGRAPVVAAAGGTGAPSKNHEIA